MQFPERFIEHISNCDGFDEIAFKEAHLSKAQVSLRLNPQKLFAHDYIDAVPWCENAFYLSERPQFVFDPLYHAGAYYVQEASSMFLDFILRSIGADKSPGRILDLCASPGGKSTLIAAAMHPRSVLISNEVIRTRVAPLKENITKWGNPNVIVTAHDAAQFQRMPNYFDIIVVDAPCSGSGLFRKDAHAMQEWSVDNVQMCSKRQQRILDDILPCLKPGGYLIYSTCSFSKEENGDVIENLLKQGYSNQNININSSQFPGIFSAETGFTFYPDKTRGEGFFISVLQKNKTDEVVETGGKQWNVTYADKSATAAIKPWVSAIENYIIVNINNTYYACTHEVEHVINSASGLFFKQVGMALGEIKNGDLIPNHAFAMSNILSEKVLIIDVDYATAIQYLKKNSVDLTATEKGWYIVKHKSISLGWIKIIPGRSNNYYPTEWRIRK